jgi:molecular chaperone Hsp33
VSLDENGGIDASGGILIQRFPDTGDEALARIEKNISSMDPSLGEILRKGGDIYSAASGLMDNNPLAILDTTNLRASCRCSRELLLDVIRKMSREDLDDMLQRDHGVELRCTFCTKKYYFGEDELR